MHLLVDEVSDVGPAIDVEFHQQIVVAGGRVDLGGDLGFGQLVGYLIRLSELAFDLDEKGVIARSSDLSAIQQKQAQLARQPCVGTACGLGIEQQSRGVSGGYRAERRKPTQRT